MEEAIMIIYILESLETTEKDDKKYFWKTEESAEFLK